MVDTSAKKQTIQSLLDKWCEECGFNKGNVVFREWKNLDHDGIKVFGNCTYMYRNLCVIRLGLMFKDRKFGYLERSVLWHEMAHAIAFLEDGISDSHNRHWRQLLWKKPQYAIGNWFCKLRFCFTYHTS